MRWLDFEGVLSGRRMSVGFSLMNWLGAFLLGMRDWRGRARVCMSVCGGGEWVQGEWVGGEGEGECFVGGG